MGSTESPTCGHPLLRRTSERALCMAPGAFLRSYQLRDRGSGQGLLGGGHGHPWSTPQMSEPLMDSRPAVRVGRDWSSHSEDAWPSEGSTNSPPRP